MTLMNPQEFKSALLNALNLGENPSSLGKLLDDSTLQYDLLQSEIESTRKYMTDLLNQNDQIRESNGSLLMRIPQDQQEPEFENEPSGIDDLLENLKY